MSYDSASKFNRPGVKVDMAKRDYQKKPFGGEPFSKFLRGVIRLLVAVFIWPFYLPRAEGSREEPSDVAFSSPITTTSSILFLLLSISGARGVASLPRKSYTMPN